MSESCMSYPRPAGQGEIHTRPDPLKGHEYNDRQTASNKGRVP